MSHGSTLSIPMLDTPKANGQDLPIIKSANNKLWASTTDPEHQLSSRGGENGRTPKKSPRASIMDLIPVARDANFATEGGRMEVEKAMQLVRAMRKENEEYQRELLRERERNTRMSLKVKQYESEAVSLQETANKVSSDLDAAQEQIVELEKMLLEERISAAQKLDQVRAKEKHLEQELAQTIANNENFSKQLNSLINRMSFSKVAQPSTEEKDEADPPLGKVAVVFTDVESSTEKWERNPELMQQSLMIHNTVIRQKIRELEGYEVKTEGDSFMVVFGSPLNSVRFALELQSSLLTADWPEGILQWPGCCEERSNNGTLLWRGMRVRVGIHIGHPTYQVDPVTGRMDYLGSPINKAARVTQMAAGGQIVVSSEMWEEVQGKLGDIDIKDLGTFQLKGISEKTTLKQLLPKSLASRTFSAPNVNLNVNTIETQLQTLVKENERLRKQIASVEKELKDLSLFSAEIEKKYGNVNLERLSTRSMHELIEAATWNDSFNRRLESIHSKMNVFKDEAESMRKKIHTIVEDRDKLTAERDELYKKLTQAEAEKGKLLLELELASAPRSSQGTPSTPNTSASLRDSGPDSPYNSIGPHQSDWFITGKPGSPLSSTVASNSSPITTIEPLVENRSSSVSSLPAAVKSFTKPPLESKDSKILLQRTGRSIPKLTVEESERPATRERMTTKTKSEYGSLKLPSDFYNNPKRRPSWSPERSPQTPSESNKFESRTERTVQTDNQIQLPMESSQKISARGGQISDRKKDKDKEKQVQTSVKTFNFSDLEKIKSQSII